MHLVETQFLISQDGAFSKPDSVFQSSLPFLLAKPSPEEHECRTAPITRCLSHPELILESPYSRQLSRLVAPLEREGVSYPRAPVEKMLVARHQNRKIQRMHTERHSRACTATSTWRV